jgi:hypothetical protein
MNKQNDIADLPSLESARLENLFKIYQDSDGRYFYNLLNTVSVDQDILPSFFTLHYPVKGDSYTGLSYRYYNTIDLWWIICAANNINDPTKMPIHYSPLRILNKNVVVALLTQINNS